MRTIRRRFGTLVVALLAGAAVFNTPAGGQDAAPDAAQQEFPQPGADIAAGNQAFAREDWPAAATAYQAALAKGADSLVVHFRLGYALHMLGKHDEALKHHLIAARISHRELRVDALYNAACAHALLENKAAALKHLQYAVDAGFADVAQIGKDTDLDSLREDEGFKRIVASIGKAPRLGEQMDFLLGAWRSKDDEGKVVREITLTRPLAGSQGIVTTNTSAGGGAWTGLLTPDAAERTWAWTMADGIGTTLRLTGIALEPNGMRFEGREHSAVGTGRMVRITLTPRADGSVRELAETSEDGAAWRVRHELTYQRRAAEAERKP